MFFSKSTNGFYDKDIHGENIPSDAVEISLEQHRVLLEGQTNGMQIAGGTKGQPVLIERPVVELSYEEKRQSEYPSIGDQLDALWKGGNAAAEMLAQVQLVKAKYPKGNE